MSESHVASSGPSSPGHDGVEGKATRARIWRIYSSAAEARRFRRPTDVVLLVLSLLAILGLACVAPGPTDLDESISQLIADLPGLAGWLWQLAYALLNVWALLIVVLALAFKGRRRLVGDYALAAALAIGMAALASFAAGTQLDDGLRSLLSPGPPPVYLAIRMAIVTAVVVTASPHLTRPLRNVARGIIAIGAIAGIGLGVAFPIGVAAGFFVGVAAAAISHLILGSPGGHPTVEQVEGYLAEIGVEATDLAQTTFTVAGVGLFVGRDKHEGGRILVKVYGRDSWDDQWVTATWSSLMRRGESAATGASRVHRVEHEAVATLMAQRAGVPVLPLIAVGETATGDTLLATNLIASPLAEVPHDELDDVFLSKCWKALRRLHDIGIAHGQIDQVRVMRDDNDDVVFADLGMSQLAASDSAKRCDDARMLVTTAILVGAQRAVAAARTQLGAEGVADLLPFLQPAVLDRHTRRAVRDGEWSLKELTAQAVEAAGVEPPKLEKLQRVTVRSTITVILVMVLSYYLITKLAGADFSSIVDALTSANYWWLLGGLLVAPLAQVSYSFGTLGASMVPLRYFPVLMLQYAIQFIAVVLPATAARLALEIRFFQRFGIAGGAAVSIGAVDAGAGFVVQIALLLLIGLSALPGFTQPLVSSTSSTSDSTSSGVSPLVIALVVAVVVGIVATLVVPKLRNRVRERIPKLKAQTGAQLRAIRETLVVLRKPSKVGQMLLGNLGAQVVQAVVLGMCLAAFGETAHLSQLILINTAVSLFAGLMPVPGGVGVAEAGYTAGLQAIGVPSAVAISTALAFRLLTFYLPPLWGSVSMRWLRKNSYV